MAFLRTAIRCSLYKKYGLLLSNEAVYLSQVARKSSQATSTILASNTAPAASSPPPKDPLDITFEDAKAAFKSKTTWELLRAYIVYTLCSFETLVNNNMTVSSNSSDLPSVLSVNLTTWCQLTKSTPYLCLTCFKSFRYWITIPAVLSMSGNSQQAFHLP